jgi:hypothetical protein
MNIWDIETHWWHIVAYLLKARTVESEKQPLLANGSEITFVSRQRSQAGSLGNSPRATIEILFEGWLSTRSVQRSYMEDDWSTNSESRVEAVSNTSTVALRVVGSDEKGSLESEAVKYGRESHETRTREWLRWRGPAAFPNDRPVL